MTLQLSAGFAFLLALPGCFVSWSGGIRGVVWDADGEHVFYVEQRYRPGPCPPKHRLLHYARADLTDDHVIDKASFFHDLRALPHGHGALCLRGGRYESTAVYHIQFDGGSPKVIRRDFPPHYDVGWMPDGKAYYYLDRFGGLHVAPLDPSPEQVLATDVGTDLGWSEDGTHFFYRPYKSGWDPDHPSNLVAFDVVTKDRRIVHRVASGGYLAAVSPDGRRVVVAGADLVCGEASTSGTSTKRGVMRVSIHLVKGSGGPASEVWSGEGVFEGLRWSSIPDTVLVAVRYHNPIKDRYARTLRLFLLSFDGRVTEIAEGGESDLFWDYHYRTNRLVLVRAPESSPEVIEPKAN